jgi:hypothetical protein
MTQKILGMACLTAGTIGTLLLMHGCCGRGADPNEPVDGWQVLRDDLFEVQGSTGTYATSLDKRTSSCPLNRLEYCIRDDAFLKAAVQPVLDRESGGAMPTTRGGVRKILGSLGFAYRRALTEPAAVERIRGLITERFQTPVANSMRDGSVMLDYGYVPFAIGVDGEGHWAEGPITAPTAWTTPDLANRIKAALVAYPQPQVIHLVAQFPLRATTRLRTLTGQPEHVLYRRGGTKITRYSELGTKFIANLPGGDLGALLTGQVSLEKAQMEKCSPRNRRGELPAINCDP